MRTEGTRTTIPNHLHAGTEPNIPKDIHSKARQGFAQWKQNRADAGKPLTTELPNPWRKGRKFNNEPHNP
jgi:hypothetical protein